MLGLLAGDLLRRGEVGVLKAGERVGVAVGGELACAGRRAAATATSPSSARTLVLHGDRRLVAEVALERLRHVPVLGPEDLVDLLVEPLGDPPRALDERRVELARGLLELRAHELGVDAGQLAIQHARADLDRLGHEAHGVVAIGGQARGGLVVDGQLLDVEPAVADVDLREGETDGSFHDQRPTVRPAPDGTARSSGSLARASHQRRGPRAGAASGFAVGLALAQDHERVARRRRPRAASTIAATTAAERCQPGAAVHVDALALVEPREHGLRRASICAGVRLP